VLALRGFFARGRVLDPATVVLVLTIAYFVTIAGGPVAVGRFRHPAMPFVSVLAGMGLVAYASRRQRAA